MNKYSLMRMIGIAMLLAAVGSAASAQQAYPSKPIRFIVPYPPGGSTTPIARLVSQKLSETWGQPVIVDNRPGGNTIIGTDALAKSAPDGYTVGMVGNVHVLMPSLLRAPYDPLKDFTPVATLTSNEAVLVVNPSVQANNLHELIALAKAKPGQLNHASSGTGSLAHLGIELFNTMTGTKIQNIPYKGSGQSMTDLLGGQVQLALNIPSNVIPHIRSGRLRAIAVTGNARMSALAEVPTFAEAGLPGFALRYWYAVLAPAGAPKPIVDKLSAEITRIMSVADTREKLHNQGMEAFISTPDQFGALMKADMARFAKIIKSANIKIDE